MIPDHPTSRDLNQEGPKVGTSFLSQVKLQSRVFQHYKTHFVGKTDTHSPLLNFQTNSSSYLCQGTPCLCFHTCLFFWFQHLKLRNLYTEAKNFYILLIIVSYLTTQHSQNEENTFTLHDLHKHCLIGYNFNSFA